RGDQRLAAAGEGRDPGGDEDPDAPAVRAGHLDLAGMEAGPHGDAVRRERVADRAGAPDASRRAVEGREESVARRLHLVSPMSLELASHDVMVALDDLAPA